jgi:hypothetical protein
MAKNAKKAKKAKKVKKVKTAARRARRAAPAVTRLAAPAVILPAFDGPGPDALVPIPPTNTFNQGLRSASEQTMLRVFGVPGQKTRDCSPATGSFKSRIVSRVDVGPFKVSGLDIAVASLKLVFADASQQIPEVVAAVKTAGMLCVRHKRTNPNSFSNHSWGSAIDIFFGSGVVPQGSHKTHRGCLQLVPFFNHHGWFWGAGFSGSSVDSMHFEVSEGTIQP